MTSNPRRRFAWCVVGLMSLAALGQPACVDQPDPDSESVVELSAALGGTITISGQVTGANGLGQPGVTVTLAGKTTGTRTTDASGNYAFTGLTAGSYSVRPTAANCGFVPDVVNLNNLAASAVQNFSGSGSGCGGTPNINSGAMTGPFTISGTVKDASGKRIVGSQINLGGAVQAVRFSDFAGRYAFKVSAGTYSLSVAGACGLTPANVSLGNVTGNRTQDFTGSGAACVSATTVSTSATGQFLRIAQGTTPIGLTVVRVETFATVATAQTRLQQITQETTAPFQSLQIAGYPAIERQVVVETPEIELADDNEPPDSLALTTAVAVGTTVVRFESRLVETPSAAVRNTFLFAGRNLRPEQLDAFHGPAPVQLPTVAATVPAPVVPLAIPPVEAVLSYGELELAASESTGAVVLAMQDWTLHADNGTSTFPSSTLNSLAPAGAAAFRNLGDPSISAGPFNGTNNPFYLMRLSLVTAPAAPALPTVAIALFKSTDNGTIFNPTPTAYPLNCFDSGTCLIPDQPKVAVDQKNRVSSNGQMFDQIYLGWRNFAVPAAGGLTNFPALACSADGGATWKFDYMPRGLEGGDKPRLSVAADGSLLVAYSVPTGGKNYDLKVQKFTSCAKGLTAAGGVFPVKVVSTHNPADMAGMPRQPESNYGIAAGDANGSMFYVSYTTDSAAGAGHENVHVAEWSDSSNSFIRDVVINNSNFGHRYFPAICATQNTVYVSWYDRRAGDDRTGYYRRALTNDGATAGVEVNVSGTGKEDPQCLAGFPGGGSGTIAAESMCTNLPNVSLKTGECHATCPAGMAAPCGSKASCDFRSGVPGGACTVSAEACEVPWTSGVAPGSPVFGDYNGVACARGKVYMAWATTTAPKDSCTMTGDACTVAAQCCSQTCVGGVCASTAAACTANGGACSADADCCTRTCQGGLCFRKVGIFTTTGGLITSVHVTGSVTTTLVSNTGAQSTQTTAIDDTILFGVDGRTGGIFGRVPVPVEASAGASLRLEPNDSDVKVTGMGMSIGPVNVVFANDGSGPVLPANGTITLSNGVSTSLEASAAPYVQGQVSFSFTLTSTQRP